MKLTNEEKLLARSQLFCKWLIEGKVEFTDLVDAYIFSLKKKNNKYRDIISGLAIPLSQYVGRLSRKNQRQNIFVKSKAIFWLLKSKIFSTAEIEKEYRKYLKKHPFKND
jgi:hypothetical protein